MDIQLKGKIAFVKKNSLAEEAGIRAGECLCAVDGMPLRDILDVSFATADSEITLDIQGMDGKLRQVTVEKDPDEDLGIAFEEAVFDGIRCCHNKCVFCFVDRMIPGLCKGLYVRDDDYRMSFLYGNFITLTNMKDEDFDRIVQTHLSPLYVSVHATDPEVRRKMMKNIHSGKIMERLQRLFDAGIHIHAQIVCCPGWNDGAVLEKSFRDLFARCEFVEDMAVVPVGLTKRTDNLPELRTFNHEEAVEMVKTVTAWQEECRRKLGKSFIYLGDEFYVLAGSPLPPAEWYDGFPQLENGIGLSRNFLYEWEEADRKQVGDTVPSTKNYVIPVGVSAYGILKPVIEQFNRRFGTRHQLLSVVNDFFGHTINVTGLLTGGDILKHLPEECPVVLPGVVLNQDNLFLDDMSLAAFKEKAARVVKTAAGAKELYALLAQ